MLSKGKVARIERIQLEMDSGKNLHDVAVDKTFVDFNRSGVGLVEIVGRPDLRSKEEANEYVQELGRILAHLGVSDANMFKGEMRMDVNVSVRPNKAHPKYEHVMKRIGGTIDENGLALGNRVEIKNLNSLKSMMLSIQHEHDRQIELIEAGKDIERETRTFDANAGKTIRLRSKEELLDYRFMPEPDLPELVIEEELIESLKLSMPELPRAIEKKLQSEYGLTASDAGLLSSFVIFHRSNYCFLSHNNKILYGSS